MEDSSLVDNINPNTNNHIVETTKFNEFITSSKYWDINPLANILRGQHY